MKISLEQLLPVTVFLAVSFTSNVAAVQPYAIPIQGGLFIPLNNITNNSVINQPPSYGFKNNISQNRNPYPPQQNGLYNNNNNNNNYNRNPPYPIQSRSTSDKQHKQVVFGARSIDDTLLLNTLVSKKFTYGFFRSSVQKDITFPDKHSNRKVIKITSIVVTDNTKDNSGGHTQVVKGGPGYPSVTLRFIGKDNTPIDLSVSIYGYEGAKR